MAHPTKRGIRALLYEAMTENEKKHATNPVRRRVGSLLISRTYHERMAKYMERQLIWRGITHFQSSSEEDNNSFAGLGDDLSINDSDDETTLMVKPLPDTTLGNMRLHAGKGMHRRKPRTPVPSPSPVPPVPPPQSSKSRKKRGRMTDDEQIMFSMYQCDRIIPLFQTDASIISVTADEYKAILAKMKPNLDRVPEQKRASKALRVNAIYALKKHNFQPRYCARRIFIDHINLALGAGNPDFSDACLACNQPIVGDYAVSLCCFKTIMHPKCAVVVMDAIGPRAYHRCLTPLAPNCFCKHVGLETSCMRDVIEEALAMTNSA
jgi:hypothetical protein